MGSDVRGWARLLQASAHLPEQALQEEVRAATEQEKMGSTEPRLRYIDVSPGQDDDPFSYQIELIDQVVGLFGDDGAESGLLALPTGGGKTITAGRAVVRLLHAGRIRHIVWTAPSIELLDQARTTIAGLWAEQQSSPELRLTLCTGGSALGWSRDREVLFASTQLLTARRGGYRSELPLDADLLVVDEAHYAGAPRLSEVLRRFLEEGVRLLGLSATPGRGNSGGREELLSIFQRRLLTSPSLGRDPVLALQQRGVLSTLHFHLIPIESAVPGLSRTRVGEPGPSIGDLIQNRARFEATLSGIEQARSHGRALVFCFDLLHACATAAALRSRGHAVGVLSGAMGAGVRDEILNAFEEGRIELLINIRVLTTGYDLPSLPSVVVTMPIESPILYEQIVGRVARGRAAGGTSQAHVFQLDDLLKMHGLPMSYHRFGSIGWQ